ncbi:hypothetical protein P153DRAFT_385469 [Dothidotthia symphoricarpi CBS 119687]|uniref:Uncharacterized protein n=1 Tax=Dothidotthia symphoricarpi CBS 119687 TaxID=1392245 RepID=A0A6A6ABU1_9PLEO|nr:uncharacterized protein P153DRAFT_385469 [Dothidotthia symphoricarpi CBS 119687]KAF2129250.1 hypothetical protein P153DRAFT_385469 [Dothidotthia symphoricarpi CBS 119687]
MQEHIRSEEERGVEDPAKDIKNEFRAQFTALADAGAYTFMKISYVNENQEGCQADMLLFGHYYLETGTPTWVHTDGHVVRYYRGMSYEICEVVPEARKSRIYPAIPFSLMGVTQSGSKKNGMTPTRQYERLVFETVIRSVFLLTGRLASVPSPQDTNTLANLKFACLNLEENRKSEKGRKISLQQQGWATGTPDASQEEQRDPDEASTKTLRYMAPRETTAYLVSTKRAHTDIDSMPKPGHNAKRVSLLNHLTNYEAEVDAELLVKGEENRYLQMKLAKEQRACRNAEEQWEVLSQRHDIEKESAARWKEKYLGIKAKYAKLKKRHGRCKDRIRVKKEEGEKSRDSKLKYQEYTRHMQIVRKDEDDEV